MRTRYSIEVTDEVVEIHGDLTIEESFDFLSFYERKGYKSVTMGDENSTLRMMKRDREECLNNQRIFDLEHELKLKENIITKEKCDHQETKDTLSHAQALIKSLRSEEYTKYKKLHEENREIIRSQCISRLEKSEEAKEIIDSQEVKQPYVTIEAYKSLVDEFLKQMVIECVSSPMTEDEKETNLNQLLQLRKDYPDILPSIEEMIEEHKSNMVKE